jgi:hypothetical protein
VRRLTGRRERGKLEGEMTVRVSFAAMDVFRAVMKRPGAPFRFPSNGGEIFESGVLA